MLGADLSITGNVHANADLHVDGTVQGDITCNALVQGESSEIDGAITSESARIAGTVRGSVNARDVVILRTARIIGDVSYETLSIEQGAQLDGRLCPRKCQQVSPKMARLPSIDILPAAAE